MNLSIKGLFLGLGALITVLLLSGLLAYQNTRQLREDAAWVTRSHQVLEALQNTLGAMTDAETGQRGYLLTGDPRYLEPYHAGLARAGGLIRELRELVRDNRRQQPRAALLEGLTEAKEKELAETVAMQPRDPEAARRMVLTHLGQSIMASIRAQVAAMSQEERILLAERERTSRRGYRTAILSGTLFALLGLAAVVIFGFQLREHLERRDRLEQALDKQRQWLQVTLGSIGDAVIANDRDGAVTFLNPVAEQLTGWTADAAAGQPLPTVFRILSEETREPAPDPAARVLREGAVVGLANHTALLGRDGRELPIEDSAAPIRDGAGEVAGVVLVFRDAAGKRVAEMELRQSEQRFRTLMELSPDAIWVNRDDRIELVNSQGLRLLGASRADQVEGRSPFEIYHPDCHDLVRGRLAAVRDGTSVHLSEETVIRLDGALRQVEVACAPFTDARGQAVQVVLRDITRRRQRDQELERLNRALRALTKSNQALMRSESIPEQDYLKEICDIFIQDCDHAMVWIGFKEDDPARSIRPAAWAGFDQGYLDTLRLTWADDDRGRGPTGTAIRTGRPCLCADMEGDPAFAPWRAEALRRGYRSSLALPLLSGGQAFAAITFYGRQANAFSAGEVALLEELTFDLAHGISTNRLRTEHALAEEAMRESEQRFRTAFEQGGIPMAITALDGRFLRGNPAFGQMLGWPEAELAELTVWDVTHPEDLVQTRAGFERLARGESTGFRLEKRYLRRDGTVIWGDMCTAVVPDAMGSPLYLVTHIQDITERKRAEEGLRLANQRKDEFLATLAHELRNPLAPIRTGAFLLGQRAPRDPEIGQIYDMIARQSANMARLVDDLLDVSRIERGRVELRKERVDLGLVVAHALEASKALIDAGGHQVTVEVADPAPVLEADPVRLEQMLGNLLSNACKCTPAGGRIQVAAGWDGDQAVLRVRDDGIGMTPEVRAHIFELFYQAHQNHDRHGGGLGIGLTLVQHLAQLHGGAVSAASDGPGLGSEFRISLPALEPGRPRPLPAPVLAQGDRRHVLVVDDDRSVRQTLEMLLQSLDYRVSAAASGARGVELALAARPDIALIDLGMPGMDGLEVAARIRAELGPAILLVALTGFSRASDIADAKAAGFDHHLTKSGDPGELMKLLGKI